MIKVVEKLIELKKGQDLFIPHTMTAKRKICWEIRSRITMAKESKALYSFIRFTKPLGL